MKVTLPVKAFLDPLLKVSGVVEKRQTLPILAHVYIELSDDGQRLTAIGTDLEVELLAQNTVEDNPDNRPGSMTLPGRKLVDICKALPESAEITLQQESDRAILSSGKSRFTLSTLPAQEFPTITMEDNSLTKLELSEKDLHFLLHRTHFAMAQQDVRYFLNGMLFEVTQDGHMLTVATDGHRLAYNQLAIPCSTKQNIKQIILPRKGVTELMRLLADEQDKLLTLHLSNNHFRVSGGNYTMTSKLIDGQFPDYNRVLPKDGNKVITVDRDTLKEVLTRVAILSNDKVRGISLLLQKDILKISAHNPEQEAAEEELQISYDGDSLEIGINVTYLQNILSAISPGKVKMTFSTPNSSLLVEEVKQPSGLYVIMPMRL